MRSRYTAYAVGDTRYLVATTAPEGPHWRSDTAKWRSELADYCAVVEFRGLEILEASQEGDSGVVAFRASIVHGDRDVSFGERSRFVRRDGRWLYVDGDRT